MTAEQHARGDVRVIRLRAEAGLVAAITLARSNGNGGVIALPPRRDRLYLGAQVRVEFGFGALCDEIVVRGEITAVEIDPDAGTRRAVVTVIPADAGRLGYVHAVLEKRREPVVRRHARAGYPLPIQWTDDEQTRQTKMGDLCAGGAFIVSDVRPALDSIVRLKFVLPDTTVEVDARVAWCGVAGGKQGFGVEFRHLRPASAASIRTATRKQPA